MTEQNRRKREQRSDQQLVKDFDAPFTALNENDFDAIWKELGGDEKWLKSFGYFQFGFHVQDAIIERLAPSANKAAAVGLTSQLRALSKEAEAKRVVEDNPNLERIYLGMREAYDEAARLASSAAPADEAKPVGEVKLGAHGKLIDWYSSDADLFALPVGTKLFTRAAPAAQPDADHAKLMREAANLLGGALFQYVDTGEKAFDLSRRIYAALSATTTSQPDETGKDKARAVAGLGSTCCHVDRCESLDSAPESAASQATSQPDEARDARLGRYVKEFAKRGGWTDDGEGAFEFIQRHSYALGLSDMGGNPSTAARADRWPVSAFAPTAASPRSGSQETPSHPDPELQKNATDILRDMLAIQEVCGLHTDEYAPGSVIEYIKELEQDAHPVQQQEQGKC